ncbi:MAG: PilZ domain-containing protein [Fibrobacter sp.]|nr:PilZ domain-containing protein [Fibrobacter sp.]
MIEPLQLFWIFGIAVMVLALLALIEIQRSYFRREHEVMFGTPLFDEQVKEQGLLPEEIKVLEKLVRSSRYENKDAILNTATLFESAVSNYYEFKGEENVKDDVLAIIAELRRKLNFTASNPLATVSSTRQYNETNRVDLLLDNGGRIFHSTISGKDERNLMVEYDESMGSGRSLVGKVIGLRWTRPEDAVYTAKVLVKSFANGEMALSHATVLEKKQLRRWVREPVDFPVKATLGDGTSCNGVLLDLSAGGILLGLPMDCSSGQHLKIEFELPSFGVENVEIEILRNLGHKNPQYADYFFLTASFVGAFGWTQERVLQYIFEVHKQKKGPEGA